ncbi:probable sesquiterpene synthase [Chenopodium quinoa]|uniref:Uncharacterized protein n=1 Tax=Chenopodium quinoa TaxID=63459 RepID=A0A803L2P7_CHEQI|nr:probable sesquiterpene synthase [Chenopodium quinoa]
MASASATSASQPIAYFHPTHWGDQFLQFTPLDNVTQLEKEQEVEHLKEQVRKELLARVATVDKPLELLDFIDAIERLGLAYYLEKEIEEALVQVYENYHDQCDKDDLYHVAARFRILRQHGYHVCSDVFKKFKNEKGSFKDCILNDVPGLLSLYEACYVRIHEDEILDEAIVFTTTHLKLMVEKLSSPLAEQVTHALDQPLHYGFVRLESKHYIGFYEQYASHNKTLVKLAKLDFNLLQLLHKQEFQDISSWWNDFYPKVPFVRDRLVEAYFWVLGCYYEREYSSARKTFIKIFMIVQVFDDVFDAYGTYDILKLLVEAVQRWDYSYIAKLPEYFDCCYQKLLETVDEVENELAKEGRSQGVECYKERMNRVCEAWLEEAKWCGQRYTPGFDEYVEVAKISIAQILGFVSSMLGMGPVATNEGIAWVCQEPMPTLVDASHVIFRLKNDLGSTEFEQNSRTHVVSCIQCYMKGHVDVDEEQVNQIIEKKVDDAWKDFNQALLRPYVIPKPLNDRILHLTRAIMVFYKDRTDGYTIVNKIIQDKVASVLVHPIPI